MNELTAQLLAAERRIAELRMDARFSRLEADRLRRSARLFKWIGTAVVLVAAAVIPMLMFELTKPAAAPAAPIVNIVPVPTLPFPRQ